MATPAKAMKALRCSMLLGSTAQPLISQDLALLGENVGWELGSPKPGRYFLNHVQLPPKVFKW